MANTIQLTDDLRELIRLGRTQVSGVTQRGAAVAAGISESAWRNIETAHQGIALAETLANMLYAVGISPEQLRAIDEPEIADLVERRLTLLEPEQAPDMEEYLRGTPGLTEEQRAVLISVANGLATQPEDQAEIG